MYFVFAFIVPENCSADDIVRPSCLGSLTCVCLGVGAKRASERERGFFLSMVSFAN